ncbi:MAG: hypothetical protein WDN02_17010 [Methylovirgula sp.]|uniref:hypothetical protein n=1 Tax=Methylovirgula sp. TaxID=1978224 RepID=UPI0030767682
MADGARPAIQDDHEVLRLHDLVSEEIRGQQQREHRQAKPRYVQESHFRLFECAM